jgi:hypothetical protein
MYQCFVRVDTSGQVQQQSVTAQALAGSYQQVQASAELIVSTDGCLQRTDGLSGPAGLSAVLSGQQFLPFTAIYRLDCRFLDDSLQIRTVKKINKTEFRLFRLVF